MKKTNISVQEEINIINAFGVGMWATFIILVIFIYFKEDPSNIIYPLLVVFLYILIKSIYLKKKLKNDI